MPPDSSRFSQVPANRQRSQLRGTTSLTCGVRCQPQEGAGSGTQEVQADLPFQHVSLLEGKT